MSGVYFDLNIETVLENWEVEHGLRELIANALDEQRLCSSKPIKIFKCKKGYWNIRDYGRGLAIEHFTQNENKEKLDRPNDVIGKFGVGLKDALATFHRRGVRVIAVSKHGQFKPKKVEKKKEEDDTAN